MGSGVEGTVGRVHLALIVDQVEEEIVSRRHVGLQVHVEPKRGRVENEAAFVHGDDELR